MQLSSPWFDFQKNIVIFKVTNKLFARNINNLTEF